MTINTVIIIGNLTRNAEMRYTNNGMAILNFSIAVNRRRKNGDEWVDEAQYFEATMMGRVAESIQRFMIKGKQVGISGELRQDRWEQDGQKRNRVYIFVNNLQLLGGSNHGGNTVHQQFNKSQDTIQSKERNSAQMNNYTQQDSDIHNNNDATDIDAFDDDIPF